MQKTALVVGGTQDFGLAISEALSRSGYSVVTISRHKIETNEAHFATNVRSVTGLQKTLRAIQRSYSRLDAVVCVVGYAEAKPRREATVTDWNDTVDLNCQYVARVFDALRNHICQAKAPMFLTFGSRWSYCMESELLLSYTVSKCALAARAAQFFYRVPKLRSLHYFVPPMDTAGYRRAYRASVTSDDAQLRLALREPVASPERIGSAVIADALELEAGAHFRVIELTGRVRTLRDALSPA